MSKKLTIKDLKVKSFVTSLKDEEKDKIKGAIRWTLADCDSREDCTETIGFCTQEYCWTEIIYIC
ncbi:MAG: hypothetical protein GY950_30365 [bacterium]|nr:hypothetical protein [bacterium]